MRPKVSIGFNSNFNIICFILEACIPESTSLNQRIMIKILIFLQYLNLKFNILDWEVSKHEYMSPKVSLRPNFNENYLFFSFQIDISKDRDLNNI